MKTSAISCVFATLLTVAFAHAQSVISGDVHEAWVRHYASRLIPLVMLRPLWPLIGWAMSM